MLNRPRPIDMVLRPMRSLNPQSSAPRKLKRRPRGRRGSPRIRLVEVQCGDHPGNQRKKRGYANVGMDAPVIAACSTTPHGQIAVCAPVTDECLTDYLPASAEKQI